MRFLLLLALLAAGHGAAARSVVDAGGRSVAVPDHVARVFAAGPPASATIYVVAPDRLVGWIRPPSDAARDDTALWRQALSPARALARRFGEPMEAALMPLLCLTAYGLLDG
jgi:ABC-type Fe3+-hydroxamate transport system substrate-binding protein